MSKEKGYIRIFRDIQEHWIWNDKPFSKGQAFIDLILRANYKDNKFMYSSNLCQVKRGEFTTSIKELSEKWGWSRWKVNSFLHLLSEQQTIAYKTDNKKTAICVLNYGVYQDVNIDKPTSNQHQTDNKPTSDRHQTDTNNKDKYKKKKEKEIKEASPLVSDETAKPIKNGYVKGEDGSTTFYPGNPKW